MTNSQYIQFALIACAFVLTIAVVSKLAPPAAADQVLTRDQLTVLTAQTSANDESLFIIDTISGKMVIYRPRVDRKKLEAVEGIEMRKLFDEGGSTRARQRRR